MNHSAVSSKSRRSLKSSDAPKLSALALAIGVALGSVAGVKPAVAGPEGGQIVAGAGSITQAGASTVITQGTERLGINWQSFNVAASESVNFNQPSSSSVALNRIFDQAPSQILGSLNANGQVFLINPNGLVFGANAQVNVGGLIASSLDISLSDFMNGRNEFNSNGNAGAVINHGLINAATGGSVTLLGGSVANDGVIVADLGQVTLGAGSHAALDFDGDGMLFFEIDGNALTPAGADAAVSNAGTIQANGGRVLLSGRAAQNVLTNVVNNTGVIRAARIDNSGGEIRLMGPGGDVLTSGTLDASGQGGAGGTVQVLGDRVGLMDNARIDVSGDTDGGVAQIGGGYQGSDPNILNAQRTYVGANATIDASAGANGNGGDVVVWANDFTRFNGTIAARGGAAQGDGGNVEVSGKKTLVYRGQVYAGASNGNAGTLLLDPENINIVGGAGPQSGDGHVPATAFDADDGATYTISENAIESSDFNIHLEAQNGITVSGTFTNHENGEADGVLLIQPDDNLTMFTRNASGEGSVGINLTGSTHGAGLTVQTQGTGTITLTAGTDGVAGAAGIIVGNLVTANRAILLTADGSIDFANINAGTGTVTAVIDYNNDDVAHLGVGGTVTAATVSFAGSNAVDDEIRGGGGSDAFVLNAANAGTINGKPFTKFASVDGRAGDDSFTFNTADFAGNVAGGDDNDTFTINFAQTGAIAGGLGNDTFNVNASSATGVSGEAGNDIFNLDADLVGAASGGDDNDTFTIAAAQTAAVAGGNGNDTFHVNVASPAGLAGEAGNDVFNLNTDLGGTAAGGDNDDTFNIAATQTGALQGGNGNDIFNVTGGVDAAVDGGANNDTVVGAAATATTFTMTAANQGSAVASGGTVTFTQVENLTGGTARDTFNLAFNLAGTASGGGDDDDFNLTANVNAGIDGGADGASGDRISAAIGQASTFNVSSANTGSIVNGSGAVTFAGVELLVGSNLADTFNLNGSITSANGGLGGDTFRFAPDVSASITGQGNDSMEATGAVGRTFHVTNDNDGTVTNGAGTITFTSIENALGSPVNDFFTLDANLSGTADGGDGDDLFTINSTSSGLLNGGEANDTFVFNGAATLTRPGTAIDGGPDAGGTDNDILVVAASTAAGGAFNVTLTASTAGTGFTGNTPGLLTGTAGQFAGIDTVSAGADDVLTGRNVASTWTQTHYNDGTRTLGFSGFGNIVAGTAGTQTLNGDAGGVPTADTFVTSGAGLVTLNGLSFQHITALNGLEDVDTFNLNGSNFGGNVNGGNAADLFNIGVSQSGAIDGDGGDDVFSLPESVSVAGGIDGDLGNDQIVAVGVAGTTFNIAASGGGTALNGGGATNFTSVETATGGAGNDTFNLLAGGINETIDGAGGTNALVGAAGAGSTFTVSATPGASNVANGGGTVGFSNIQSLTGNTATDIFNLGASIGTVDGAGGDDQYALGAGIAATIADSAGANDTLTGSGTATLFTINGANAGSATTNGGATVATFSGIEGLTGGGGVDTFQLNASFGGVLSGGAGGDIFNVASSQTGAVRGGSEDDVFSLAAGVTANIDGEAGTNDQIVAAAGGSDTIFNVAASGGGTAVNGGTATFTSVERLTGNVGNDVFNLAAAVVETIDGAAGTDTVNGAATSSLFTTTATGVSGSSGFVSNAGSPVNFSGIENLTGGANGDSFSLNFSLPGTADGGAGDDTFFLGAGVTATLVGNAGNDDLNGASSSTVFTVTGTNAGTAVNNGGTATFSTIEHIAGGGAADTFALNADFGGTVLGAGGDDTFNVVTTQTGTISGGVENDVFNLGAGVTATVAGDAGANTVVGAAAASTFTTTAAGIGTVANGGGTVTFSGIANLTGGAAADTFNLNASLTGVADGAGGDDVFALGAGLAGTVAGGAGTNSVIGAATASTFTTAGAAGAGTVANGGGTVTFSGITNLTGGAAADTFNLNANLAGTADGSGGNDAFNLGAGVTAIVAGNAGNDTLTGAATASTFTVTGANAGTAANGAGTVTFSTIESLGGGAGDDTFVLGADFGGAVAGNAGNDTFRINAATTAATSLSGGTGNDTFIVANGVVVGGAIDGGLAGGDVLDLSAYTTGRNVQLTGSDADGFDGTDSSTPNGFLNFDDIRGSATAANVITGLANAQADWVLAGNTGNQYTSGNRTLAFSSFSTVNGGAGVDAFTLAAGTRSGTLAVNGGGGADTLNVTGAFTVSGGDLTLTNVETVTDTSGAIVTAGTLVITGATGGVGALGTPLKTNVNAVNITGGAVTLQEQSGSVVLDVDSGTSAVTVTVLAGDAVLGLLKGSLVTVTALTGNLLHNGTALAPDISAGNAALNAGGSIGTPAAAIVVDVPATGKITLNAATGATIENLNGASVSNIGTGVVRIVSRALTAAANAQASANASRDLVTVDWAGLDPNVALVDCLQPCVKLPADQSEDPALAQIREATKFLLIRTDSGWKMIPVFPREAIAAN